MKGFPDSEGAAREEDEKFLHTRNKNNGKLTKGAALSQCLPEGRHPQHPSR